MAKCFSIAIEKITKKGKRKEICYVFGDMSGMGGSGLMHISNLDRGQRSILLQLLHELKEHLAVGFDENTNFTEEESTKSIDDNNKLEDNVIDVKKLDESDMQYVFETCVNYVETFARSVGWDEDLDIINKLIGKATVEKVLVPVNTTIN